MKNHDDIQTSKSHTRFLAFITIILALGISASANASILINEILYDPAIGSDANGDGQFSVTGDEFIELANRGSFSISLLNWTLSDTVGTRHTFGNVFLDPGLGLVVFGGGTVSITPPSGTQFFVANSGSLGLNNGGDTVTLRNDLGNIVIDSVTYGSGEASDQSLTRSPDFFLGPLVPHETVSAFSFSPGLLVDGTNFQAATVPVPAAGWLLGSSLIGLIGVARRKKI